MTRPLLLVVLPAFLGGLAGGCLFSSDTEGLKCNKNAHCQAGQSCVDNVCTKSGADTGGGTGGETEGTGGGTAGGSSGGTM